MAGASARPIHVAVHQTRTSVRSVSCPAPSSS
jgi:hypothetical protein